MIDIIIGAGMFFGFLVLLLTALAFGLYLLGAIGLYKMGKNANVEYSWLAFVPFFNFYVVGKIIRKIKLGKITIGKPELFLPLCVVILSLLSSFDSIIASLIALLLWIILFVIMPYNLFKLYRRDKATLYTVISLLIPGAYSVLLFILRNESPVYDEEYSEYDYYNY